MNSRVPGVIGALQESDSDSSAADASSGSGYIGVSIEKFHDGAQIAGLNGVSEARERRLAA